MVATPRSRRTRHHHGDRHRPEASPHHSALHLCIATRAVTGADDREGTVGRLRPRQRRHHRGAHGIIQVDAGLRHPCRPMRRSGLLADR
jgi:hypothetical protein